jgi:hypothetical protein
MVIDAIKKAYEDAKIRNWDTLYSLWDIHSTVLVPDYDENKKTELKFYPFAKEVLQLLSNHQPELNEIKQVLIMFTCSFPDEIERYQKFFKEHHINFKYVNENPDVHNTRLGCFTNGKYYCNFGFDDKFGFQPYEYEEIYNFFIEKLSSK